MVGDGDPIEFVNPVARNSCRRRTKMERVATASGSSEGLGLQMGKTGSGVERVSHVPSGLRWQGCPRSMTPNMTPSACGGGCHWRTVCEGHVVGLDGYVSNSGPLQALIGRGRRDRRSDFAVAAERRKLSVEVV